MVRRRRGRVRVGRVIRALRLSSQPPKAGVPFPAELAQRLTDGANASLTPTDGAERWCAVLEAAAFSPIRTHVAPSGPPATVADELRATVTRLAPAAPGRRDVRHRAGRQRVDAQAAAPDRPPEADQAPRKPDAPAAGPRPKSGAAPKRPPPAAETAAAEPTTVDRRQNPSPPQTTPTQPTTHRAPEADEPRLRHHLPRRTRNTVTKPSRAPTSRTDRREPAPSTACVTAFRAGRGTR